MDLHFIIELKHSFWLFWLAKIWPPTHVNSQNSFVVTDLLRLVRDVISPLYLCTHWLFTPTDIQRVRKAHSDVKKNSKFLVYIYPISDPMASQHFGDHLDG